MNHSVSGLSNLKHILPNFCNLHKLDLTGTKADDSLMKVIGEHCPKLMELRLFRGKNRTIRSLMCTSWRDLRNSVCRRKTFTHELWQQKTEQVKRQRTDLLTQLEFIHQLNPVSQKSANVWQNGYWIRWGPIHLDESYGHTHHVIAETRSWCQL